MANVQDSISLLTENDLYLFNQGSHFRLYDKLGAHIVKPDENTGTYFAVWAPNANYVAVIGEFNGWDKGSHRLHPKGESGIWEGFFPGIGKGTLYKYHIASRFRGYRADKADPYAFRSEEPPRTGSIVWNLDYQWQDAEWMKTRSTANALDAIP